MPNWFFAGSRPTFTFLTSVTGFKLSGSASVVVPATVQAGDVLIHANSASSGGAVPASLIPPGFTLDIDSTITASGSSGRAKRVTLAHKLADGSEAGQTYYGMSSSSASAILAVFRSYTGEFGTLSSGDKHAQIGRGSISPQVVSASGQVLPLIVFGVAAASVSGTLSMSQSDATIPPTFASNTYLILGYKIFNSNPANVTLSMTGGDGEKMLGSLFLTGDV